LRLVISGGQVHDSQVMDAFPGWDETPQAIVADKAYGSAAIRQGIADEGALAVIPTRAMHETRSLTTRRFMPGVILLNASFAN
jgi:hypothetical protein